MWEKRFNVTRSGCVVLANYAKQITYRLRFSTITEADLFVERFKMAQREIAESEKLNTKIAIHEDTVNQMLCITFANAEGTSEMKIKMDSISELCSFRDNLRRQITKYSM